MRNWTPVMRGRRQRRGRVSDREYLRKDKKRDCVRGKGISWKKDQHRGYRGKEISAKKEHQTRALCLRTDALKCAVRDSNPGHPD